MGRKNITESTKRILFALSGNKCANPSCYERLVEDDDFKKINISNIAHICAAETNGPRYDPNMTDDERRDFDNLILLCPKCHEIVDKNSSKYTVELLKNWKKENEKKYKDSNYAKACENYFRSIKSQKLQECEIEEDKLYSTSIIITSKNLESKNYKNGKLCLADYLLDLIKSKTFEELGNICIYGVGGVGKSTNIKLSINKIISVLKNGNIYEYNFLPIVLYYDLKAFDIGCLRNDINKLNENLVFLDGFDEIIETKKQEITGFISTYCRNHNNTIFILSGRLTGFSDELLKNFNPKIEINLSYDNEDVYNKYIEDDWKKIPFYRNIIEKEAIEYKHPSVLLEKYIKCKLKCDFEKHKLSKNEPVNKFYFDADKNIEDLIVCIEDISYDMFLNSTRIFDHKLIKEKSNDNDLANVISQCFFINYDRSKEHYYFTSEIFFEYFLVLKLSKLSYRKIKKYFFGKNNIINAENLNILQTILIQSKNVENCKKLISKLSKIARDKYILLTDFQKISDDERYRFYINIVSEYSKERKLIYYSKFNSNSYDILDAIPSLSDKLNELLPNSKKIEELKRLKNNLLININNLEQCNKFEVINDIILLGGVSLHRIWLREQEKELKDLSLILLRLFINDNKLKSICGGFCSELGIIKWFDTYGWTNNWKEDDYSKFVNSINNKFVDIYSLNSKAEFEFKLDIFIMFYNSGMVDETLKKLFKNLSIYVISNKIEVFSTGLTGMRSKYDDCDINPIRFDLNKLCFSNIFDNEQYGLDSLELTEENNVVSNEKLDRILTVQDALEILSFASIIKERDASDLCRKIVSALHKFVNYKLANIRIDDVKNILTICKNSKWNSFNIVSSIVVMNFVNLLSDDLKLEILDNLNDDFKDIDNNISFVLLNVENNNSGYRFLEEIKVNNNILYKDTLWEIFNRNKILTENVEHKLKDDARTKAEYNEVFKDTIKQENVKRKLLDILDKEIKARSENDINLIQDKNLFLDEIRDIEEYKIGKNIDYSKLFETEIRINIEIGELKREEELPKIFSPLVLKFLSSYACEFKNNSEKINFINDYLNNETYWIAIYWILKTANAKFEYYLENKNILDNVKQSMKDYILKHIYDVSAVNLSINNFRTDVWFVPFVFYIKTLYDGKLPNWFDKNIAKEFIGFPTYKLHYTGLGYAAGLNFDFLNGDSVFDWLINNEICKQEVLIEYSLSIYDKIKDGYVKSVIIDFLVKYISKSSKCYDDAIKLLLSETNKELNKKYDKKNVSCLYNSLSQFWQHTNLDLVDELTNTNFFKNINPLFNEESNYLYESIFNYLVRQAGNNSKTKNKIIKIFKRSVRNIKVSSNKLTYCLSKLGDTKSIRKIIDSYIKDNKKIDSQLEYFSLPFGKLNKISITTFCKYLELLGYSVADLSNDKDLAKRRGVLFGIAKNLISQNINHLNIHIAKFRIKRIIKYFKKNNIDYNFLGLENFINQLNQIIYNRR